MMRHIERIGKVKERFAVSIKFLTCQVLLNEESYITISFKRGPQTDETQKKKVEQSVNRVPVKIDINQGFTRTSGFYFQIKNGKPQYQQKLSTIKVKKYPLKQLCDKADVISKVDINLSNYINKGLVQEELKLSGQVFFLTIEISVQALNQKNLVSIADQSNIETQQQSAGTLDIQKILSHHYNASKLKLMNANESLDQSMMSKTTSEASIIDYNDITSSSQQKQIDWQQDKRRKGISKDGFQSTSGTDVFVKLVEEKKEKHNKKDMNGGESIQQLKQIAQEQETKINDYQNQLQQLAYLFKEFQSDNNFQTQREKELTEQCFNQQLRIQQLENMIELQNKINNSFYDCDAYYDCLDLK